MSWSSSGISRDEGVQVSYRLTKLLYPTPTKLLRPFALDPARALDHHPFNVPAPIGRSQHHSAAVMRGRDTPEVPGAFKPSQEVVHGLFGHIRPGGQLRWADPIRSGALKDIHVSGRKACMTGGPKVGVHPLTNVEMESPDQGGKQGRIC